MRCSQWPKESSGASPDQVLDPRGVCGKEGIDDGQYQHRAIDVLAGRQSELSGATSKSVGRDWSFVKDRLYAWADGHHAALQMQPDSRCPIEVEGFHSMFRVGSDGQLLTEAGVQFVQTSPNAQPVLGGLVPRAGTTVVFPVMAQPDT